MQLSPKSIFFGLVAFGLPIAVAVGWNLAGPARQPITAIQNGGSGGIGAAAPDQGAGDGEPLTSVHFSARPSSPSATSPSTITSAPTPAGPPQSAGASPSVTPPVSVPSSSTVPLPPLDQPPVPTPTEITDLPGPSGSSSADPSGEPSTQP